ncbi:MAG: hypothetical protein ACM3NV_07445 [Syntrophothermus sp.]
MDHEEPAINSRPPRGGVLLDDLHWVGEEATWGFRRRLIWPLRDWFGSLHTRLVWPLRDSFGPLRRRLIWPLQDWFGSLRPSNRVALAGGSVIAAAAAAVVLLAVAGSGTSTRSGATVVAVAENPAPAAATSPARKPGPSGTTLGGAPPVFTPVTRSSAGVKGSSRAVAPTGSDANGATTTTTSPAATARISSTPGAGSAAPTEAQLIPGKPAGPKAIAVAHRFSRAFVVFETGGENAAVRRAFAATATPKLAKALLKRPPRLPADVKVPKAKVVTVVPGPSREGVYTVSVSLLRVGVTSELRLEMEMLKREGWRVTNILG